MVTRDYFYRMHAVGIKTLKSKLSEYLRAVAAGETVLVTDRNRVVAEIIPPSAGRSPVPSDAMMAEAVRKGWVSPPALAAKGVPQRKPVMKLADLMNDLRDDREAR